MAHPTREETSTPRASSRPMPGSTTRKSTTTPDRSRKSRASRSPVPKSSSSRQYRPTLSPMARRSNHSSSSSNNNNNNTFLKYCQTHGHQVAQEQYNHRNNSHLPLNRLMSSDSNESSHSLGNSSDHNHKAHWDLKFGNAADQAAGWLWKQPPPQNHHHHSLDYHPLRDHAQRLQYTPQDVLQVALDGPAFGALQDGLRKRGCITNNYLKENLHFYVQHIQTVQRQKAERKASRSPMRQRRTNVAA